MDHRLVIKLPLLEVQGMRMPAKDHHDSETTTAGRRRDTRRTLLEVPVMLVVDLDGHPWGPGRQDQATLHDHHSDAHRVEELGSRRDQATSQGRLLENALPPFRDLRRPLPGVLVMRILVLDARQ